MITSIKCLVERMAVMFGTRIIVLTKAAETFYVESLHCKSSKITQIYNNPLVEMLHIPLAIMKSQKKYCQLEGLPIEKFSIAYKNSKSDFD